MALKESFSSYCESILLDNLEEMKTSIGEIAKKLNAKYYDLVNDKESHMYVVGSVGRNTAIKNASDLDILFDLPSSVYTRFDGYEGNGQSQLLQEIKNVLKERYPKTELHGDGQVVSIEFAAYTIELVPGFKQSDNTFKFPDSNNGGLWRKTDPLSEQAECSNCEELSSHNYYNFCHIIRGLKNNVGFSMGGLLIDTLVYNHFVKNNYYKGCTFEDYLDILLELLAFLKELSKDQSYWLAVGSNQQVINTDEGKWISKFEAAYDALIEAATSDDIFRVLTDLLGKDFTNNPAANYRNNDVFSLSRSSEQFISDFFPVDIRYSLQIDCKVTQDGWRPALLSEMLKRKQLLLPNKKLDFYISGTNCPRPYQIYWKVRNVGDEAIRRDMIRGQVKCTNDTHQIEHTDFKGPHFVECYLIKNGICVAKARIDVPIKAM